MTLVLQVTETTSTGYREAWESGAISRNFIVTNSLAEPGDTDDLATAIDLHDGRAAAGIPVLGETHPDLGWPCTSVSADYADSNYPHAIRITVEYRQSLPTVGSVEFTQIQLNPRLEYVDTYRAVADGENGGAPIPANGTVTDANRLITDGDCVANGGDPISTAIVSGTLTISYDQSGLPYWVWLLGHAGKRNSVDFIGFNPGALVYMGPSIRRTGSVVSSFEGENFGTYEITHSFNVDAWLHCRQYAPISTDTGLPLVNTDGCTEGVKWVQPYDNTVNFWTFGIPGLDAL
jgi:hypothetical protein